LKLKVFIGIAVVAAIAVSAASNWTSCAWFGYQTDRTTRYAMGVGCLVKMPTGWTPRSEIRTEQ